jgi:hypothetical protein
VKGDLPLVKALKKQTPIVTAWPAKGKGADIVYNPEQATYEEIAHLLPKGFDPDAILLTNLDYHTFVLGLDRAPSPVVCHDH